MSRAPIRVLLATVSLLCLAQPSRARLAVADINIQPLVTSSSPREFVGAGTRVFFVATTPAEGVSLWMTDGTGAGTVLLHAFGGVRAQRFYLTAVGDTAFFAADDLVSGVELWRSDGTPGGTARVRDIQDGVLASNPRDLVALNGKVYFSADDGIHGDELWVSDGTENGTQLVRDIGLDSEGSFPSDLVVLNGALYFAAEDAMHGNELWRSDGTADGTTLVRDIVDGPDGSFPGFLATAGSQLFFAADDGTSGDELWASDGTSDGTHRVRDIEAGPDASSPAEIIAVGTRVFFTAADSAHGNELWLSDGTEAGTTLVRDIVPGPDGSFPFWLTALDDHRLAFTATTGDAGEEPWSSDGTDAGTFQIVDLVPGPQGSVPTFLTARNGQVFMSAEGPLDRRSLWSSDGTAGNINGYDISQGVADANPAELSATPLGLFLAANDGLSGIEPWMVSDTAPGVHQLANIAPDDVVNGSFPSGLIRLGDVVLFSADDGISGRELWSSDAIGCVGQIRDINPHGDGFSVFTDFTRLGDAVFFAADDGEHGTELWRSDGTTAGTTLWNDIAVGGDSGNPHQLTAVGDTLYFVANEGFFGDELWRTDASGRTFPLRDINPDGGSEPQLLTPYGAQVAFAADDGEHGVELWMSDGTAPGTRLVRDINPTGSAFPPPHVFFMVASGDTLFFTADDGEHGTELWRSDGTEDGTVLVRDIQPGEIDSNPQFLVPVGDGVDLIADDGVHGLELWHSDGTEAGTAMIADINPSGGAFGTETFFFSFGLLNDVLYFAATDGQSGVELWRTDGSAAGTTRVADINAGPDSSFPAFLTPDGDRLLFQACEPVGGCEPWQALADGTVARLVDALPGSGSSNPSAFTPLDGSILFTGASAETGVELLVLGTAASDCNDDGAVTIDELVRAVRVALGELATDVCPAADRDGDGTVSISELIAAVNVALAPCA